MKRKLTAVEIAAPGHAAKGDFVEYETFIAAGDPEAHIDWPDGFHRNDIGWRAISRERNARLDR